MSLYIGTNYHPHDWPEEQWIVDINLMKQAGFTTVRLGHLCWDSYEPEEGVYTFEWFDRVMDLFAEAGIGVLLDISMRPAPIWVHKLCPGCNIYGKSGTRQDSLRRYMEDVSDPAYQQYAMRFAEKLVCRYKNHPALVAFGLCNEIGDGFLSHSEDTRRRFSEWLKKKYGNVEALNEAWVAKRWSRKLTSFDDAVLQENELAAGAPEAWLDMRRFFSDENGEFIVKLRKIVEKNAPGIPHSSNHYAEKDHYGFDYLKFCDSFVDYPGIGFYPGYSTGEKYQYMSTVYMQRLSESGKPMWCLEFQSGSRGIMSGPPGALHMMAMLCLLNRAEMILGWTWRSMLGGEEQYLFGLLSHDGIPTANYDEYKKIAADMNKLQKYGFPYLPKPDTAIAYSYDSAWVSQYGAAQYQQTYHQNMVEVHKAFYESNRDYNVVDLRNLKNNYRLIIIPGHILIGKEAAEQVRRYVDQGGTVIMTGYSASVDETGKVFSTSKPGYMADVFGIRVAGFFRTDMAWTFSSGTERNNDKGTVREILRAVRDVSCYNMAEEGKEGVSRTEPLEISYYEVLEPRGADVYAYFEEKNIPAVTMNQYGKGKAFYVAAESNVALIRWLLDILTDELGLKRGMIVPRGIQTREIAENQYFYVNTCDQEIKIPINGKGRGVLRDMEYDHELILPARESELVII